MATNIASVYGGTQEINPAALPFTPASFVNVVGSGGAFGIGSHPTGSSAVSGSTPMGDGRSRNGGVPFATAQRSDPGRGPGTSSAGPGMPPGNGGMPWEFDLQGPHVRATSVVRSGASASAVAVSTITSLSQDMEAAATAAGNFNTFKVLTWNGLAEGLDRQTDFPRTPPFALDFWNFRLPFTIDALNAVGADVICMQEINHPEFLAMQLPDYRMIFVAKLDSPCMPHAPPDGCCMLVRKSRFEVLGVESIYYHAPTGSDFAPAAPGGAAVGVGSAAAAGVASTAASAGVVPATVSPAVAKSRGVSPLQATQTQAPAPHIHAPFDPVNGGAAIVVPVSGKGNSAATTSESVAATDSEHGSGVPAAASAADSASPDASRKPAAFSAMEDDVDVDLDAPLTNQTAIVARLRCLRTRKTMLVATTHLKAKVGNEVKRQHQITQLLARIKIMTASSSIPVVLCGDFNSDPAERVVFEQVYQDPHVHLSSCFNSFTQMQEFGRVVHFHDAPTTKSAQEVVRPLGPMKRQSYDSYASSEPTYTTWKVRGVGAEVLTKRHTIDYLFATLASDFVLAAAPAAVSTSTTLHPSDALPTTPTTPAGGETIPPIAPLTRPKPSLPKRTLKLVNCMPILGPEVTGFRGLPSAGFPSDHLFLCAEFMFN